MKACTWHGCLWTLLLLGCSSGQTGDAGLGVEGAETLPRGQGGGAADEEGETATLDDAAALDDAMALILLQDIDNYSVTRRFEIPRVQTKAATDLDICWDGLLRDLGCRDVDPAKDVDSVAFMRIRNATPRQVESMLPDKLSLTELREYFDGEVVGNETCLRLSQLGNYADPTNVEGATADVGNDSYLVWFTKGTLPGMGVLSMIFVVPNENSDNLLVEAPSACATDGSSRMMPTTVDLTSAEPLRVPENGRAVLDWNELTQAATGEMLWAIDVDGGFIAFYEGADVSDLEQSVERLEESASSRWTFAPDASKRLDLRAATHVETGAPFSGFDRADGVWIFALTCSACLFDFNPVVATVVQPVSP